MKATIYPQIQLFHLKHQLKLDIKQSNYQGKTDVDFYGIWKEIIANRS